MKASIGLLLAVLMILTACEKDESSGSLGSSPKLLVAIREDNHLVTSFEYDSLDRLVRLHKYFDDTVYSSEFYRYDTDNKLIMRAYSGYTDTYQYTLDGRLKATLSTYNETNTTWKTEYQYRGNRIYMGMIYHNDELKGWIAYKYDSSGNTIERTEYPHWPERGDFLISQFKLEYDNKINPLKNPGVYPVDIVQHNNPTYFYHYLVFMSSFPPEYYSTYDYDTLGLPVKEYRNSRIFDYEYVDKRE